MDELELIDEQAEEVFFIDRKELSVYDYLEGVDTVLSLVRDGDFEAGANTLRSMTSLGHAIGISKAKLLHGMYTIWMAQHNKESDEQFFEYIAEFGMLKNRIIAERYIHAWEAYLRAPADYCERMLLQPMKNLNALGAAVSQGYDPSSDEWEELADASSNGEFLNTIRKVKGKEPRKSSLVIHLEPNGDLIAVQGDVIVSIGYLNLSGCEDSSVVNKAVERIVKGAGIFRH